MMATDYANNNIVRELLAYSGKVLKLVDLFIKQLSDCVVCDRLVPNLFFYQKHRLAEECSLMFT